MLDFKIDNCNNIISASLNLKEDSLNIRYAMNGTGKSTIGKAIQLTAEGQNLTSLKTFGSESIPTCTIPDSIHNVLLFNEDFVNTIVFRESSVIENAFDVFIKNDRYLTQKGIIDQKLNEIHIDTTKDKNLSKLFSTGQTVLNKFTLTKNNDFKKTGLFKNLSSADSIFQLPEPIKKFKPLMESEYKVDWAGWKNDGAKYDSNGICPFCTAKLDENYETEKEIFSESYSKSNVKSIIEMISYFEGLKEYIIPEKYEILLNCIKNCNDEQELNLWMKRFYSDLNYLISKIQNVIQFNSYTVKREDLGNLGDKLKLLLIDVNNLEIFNNDITQNIIIQINDKINDVLSKTVELKKEISIFKGCIGDSIKNSVTDINEFLDMAGINYSLELQIKNEADSKAILKYRDGSGNITVDNIKLHLSWGERNAFALVLFMHYAFSKNADLVILDDPISSFDSTKKYAIIDRLFLNAPGKKSLYRKTVLMLTHDFQPVIDFVVNHKPNGGSASAFFLRNQTGIVSETEIEGTDIKSLPILLSENASDNEKNTVHRVTCLRKLLEHTKMRQNGEIAYNLLSSLLKGKAIPSTKDNVPFSDADIVLGEKFIKTYITDFSYKNFYEQFFSRDSIIGLYKSEKNNYYKLQVFRVLLSIDNLRSKIDDPLLKYIDEQFHIENDYIYYLDFEKYDIVPDFVIPKCDEFLNKEKIEI